jgi:hypothetical protein
VAVDFQVCFPQEIVNLSSIQEVSGMTPRTVNIVGQDFRSVDEVLINGVQAPDVVVLGRRRLLAQVPPQLGYSPVSSVSVISNSLAITNKSILRFRIGPTPSKVTGILRLVQVFLKILFTTPGRDIFAPRIGAAALSKIGVTFGADEGGNIVSDFVVSVGTTQRQIVAIQARDPSIPPDERLLSAIVASAGYNQQEAALVVSVEITSQTGRSALANVVV